MSESDPNLGSQTSPQTFSGSRNKADDWMNRVSEKVTDISIG